MKPSAKETFLTVESPCAWDWQAMTGDDQTRFCQQCDKHVHHLSAMPLKQVKRLLASANDLCVRYETDATGQVITLADKPPFWFFYRDLPKKVAVILVLVLCLTAGQSQAETPLKAMEPVPVVQGGLHLGPTPMGDVVTAPKKAAQVKPVKPALPAKTGPKPMVMGKIALPKPEPKIEPKPGFLKGQMEPNATLTGRALVVPKPVIPPTRKP